MPLSISQVVRRWFMVMSQVVHISHYIGFENPLTSSQLPLTHTKGGPSPSSLTLLSSSIHLISSLLYQFLRVHDKLVRRTGMDKDNRREWGRKLGIRGRRNLLYT
jgi:hypothetical protein